MKIKLLMILVLLLVIMAGCDNTTKNNAPTIEGVNAIECIANSTVDLLNGVIAYDKEDGDITPDMNISINPYVLVTDGYAIFEEAGSYKVKYEVKDSANNNVIKYSDINVTPRDVYYDFKTVNGFYTSIGGHATLTSGGMYNEEYIVEATGCEVFEDLSLNRTFDLKLGTEYTFKYKLNTLASGVVRVLVDDKKVDDFTLNEGDNEILFTYLPQEKSTITISLLLGALGEEVKCILTGVEINYLQEAGMVEISNGFNVLPRFDGTSGNAYFVNEGAKLEVTKVGDAMWRGGMFISTEIPTNAGDKFVISFDIERSKLNEVEVAIQNAQWNEKKYDTVFVNNQNYKNHYEVTITVTDANKGALWFYVQSGKYLNDVIFSNLSVKTELDPIRKESLSLLDFRNDNEGYECELETFAGGFSYYIESFANVDYMQKVTSPAFYINGSGSNYIITFKAKASKPTEVVFAGPISGGWDPTWIWTRFTITEEEKVYTFIPGDAGGDRYNEFVWQFGSSNNQRHNNVTITISDIKICYKNAEYDGE